jgi:beta-phosphoglucomutase-like phosphatase (HAD superfamily)
MRALIFDLDCTLVDTVSTHVIGWEERASNELGLTIEAWPIHRRTGACHGLSTRTLARESGRLLTPAEAESLACRQGELFENFLPNAAARKAQRLNK